MAETTIPLITISNVEHVNGHITRIWVTDEPVQIDVCDCHKLAWPATSLTYHEGADSWDCPLVNVSF